ncbi:MAG: hypothetical protein ACO1QB_12815 [Verrucomicrobiales bacterium]
MKTLLIVTAATLLLNSFTIYPAHAAHKPIGSVKQPVPIKPAPPAPPKPKPQPPKTNAQTFMTCGQIKGKAKEVVTLTAKLEWRSLAGPTKDLSRNLPVTFQINGAFVTAFTDGSGTARVNYQIPAKSTVGGVTYYTCTFAGGVAGNNNLGSAVAVGSVQVLKPSHGSVNR